jgi:L-serine dehydratase
MNVFDIIGPVIVGPSSSHTAGALRLGRITRKLLGEDPAKVIIKLHGSFAKTYKGHGTDKAILGGLMGMAADDLRIKDSIKIAGELGLSYHIELVDLKDVHPNTALIEIEGVLGKKLKIQGSSVGGGSISIKQINGIEVDFNCEYSTMIITHRDKPGSIASVTSVLGNNREINIAYMKVFRTKRGGEAMMIIETDQRICDEVAEKVREIPIVSSVTILEPV